MRYHDWHAEPGYWNDVVRHFDPGDLLLDLGCGSAWLGGHFPRYVGVDDHPEALAGSRARVVRGDVARLPLADATFDAVVCKDVLEHVADPRLVIREVRRVLRPGGRVYVSVPDAQRWVWEDYTHVRPYPRRALRRLLTDEGLTVERLGHESVMAGVGIVSRWSPWHRRPWPYRLLARTRLARRNVWALARA
ncbi:MAG TPA: class I SAM-dependent methyltransferase [Frankiaceae bacterium]|nr:class I SAM-dependent methyltransferase [Frankiaceae bacterium]